MSSLPSAATPKPVEDVQGDSRWMDMVRKWETMGEDPAHVLRLQHHRFVSEAREREPDILFVGDSLVQRLINAHIWERVFCQMHSLNFGMGGDRTEHLLWRLQNGELEGLSPKV